jgi:hypothetical protein
MIEDCFCFFIFFNDDRAMMPELKDQVLSAPLTGLQVKESRVCVPFPQEGDTRSPPSNGSRQGSQSEAFIFEFFPEAIFLI